MGYGWCQNQIGLVILHDEFLKKSQDPAPGFEIFFVPLTNGLNYFSPEKSN